MSLHSEAARGRLLIDLADAPDGLRRLNRWFNQASRSLAYRRDRAGAHENGVLLTGMGSSFNACLATALDLRTAGRTAIAQSASDFAAPTGAWVLVAVSNSGSTSEVINAVQHFREHADGVVVAVTNNASSALGVAADQLVELCAGCEGSFATKSYVLTVAALQTLLSAPSTGPQVPRLLTLADEMEQMMATDHNRWGETGITMASCEAIYFLGSKSRIGLAHQGALLMSEAARVPSLAMTTSEFLHGTHNVLTRKAVGLVMLDAPSEVTDEVRARVDAARHGEGLTSQVTSFGASTKTAESLDFDVVGTAPVAQMIAGTWSMTVDPQ